MNTQTRYQTPHQFALQLMTRMIGSQTPVQRTNKRNAAIGKSKWFTTILQLLSACTSGAMISGTVNGFKFYQGVKEEMNYEKAFYYRYVTVAIVSSR